MFFVLSKLLDLALAPLTWAVICVVIAVRTKRRGRRVRAGLAAVLLLVVFAWEPVSNALVRSLERSAVKTTRADATYDVVILLGGVVNERAMGTFSQRSFNENNERLLETFDLLRQNRASYAIVSGGSRNDLPNEARVLVDQLVQWGIDPSRLVVEPNARNTRENATLSARIVRERGWTNVVIVTSAMHMKRARGCFAAVGLDVDTLPVDFRSHDEALNLLPRAEYLNDSTVALREWTGRSVYRLQGYAIY